MSDSPASIPPITGSVLLLFIKFCKIGLTPANSDASSTPPVLDAQIVHSPISDLTDAHANTSLCLNGCITYSLRRLY
jgi:hypothetical protein